MKTRTTPFVTAGLTLVCYFESVSAGVAAVGDFNADGFADLAIGVSQETVGTVAGAGAVNVIYGTASGLHASSSVTNQLWHQNRAGIEDSCEAADNFGAALATGDFDNDGFYDLAIGI